MRVERMRIYDHPRIHPGVGIEGSLEFAESIDQVARIDCRQQLRTCDPVAMLSRQRAAKFRHQGADLLHGAAKYRHALGRAQLETDARMNTAFAEVSIIGGGRERMARQEAVEAPQVCAQLL